VERVRGLLREAGLDARRCERAQPNLEDVFVAATQARKAARDGSA
jgi:hypothetical protein